MQPFKMLTLVHLQMCENRATSLGLAALGPGTTPRREHTQPQSRVSSARSRGRDQAAAEAGAPLPPARAAKAQRAPQPPARPAAPRPAAPLTRSPSGGPVRPLARSPARRPIGVSAPATTADAGPQNSGPALCDTAHQSPASAGGAIQSACEGRGRAFRGWRLLGCRGRTGVQEGLSVERGPDVDPLLVMREPAGARQKAGDLQQATGQSGAQGGAPWLGHI